MREALYIAGKELRSYFVSPVAYVIVAFWLVATGFFFYASISLGQQATLRDVFGVVIILLLLIAPALTMRLLSEESRTGTLELLLTAPVKDWAVVLGKFLGAFVLYAAMMLLTIAYPLLLVLYKGNPDWGPIWSGYLGLLLVGMLFLSVGLFASALTSNMMVSAVIAFVLLLLLFVISQLSQNVGPGLGDFLTKISVGQRFDPFQRGVVDLRDIVFFVSVSALVLFLTVQVVEARRYRA
ncbi:MAG: ABC transporter permease [Chloroflexia bacterium]